ILRLLEKDREVRYQTAADVRADLKRVARDSTATAGVGASSGGERGDASPRGARLRTPRATVVIAILVLAAALGSLLYLRWSVPRQPVTSPAEWVQLTDFADSATEPAFSPDGHMLTFIRGGQSFPPRNAQIYVKGFPRGEAVQLTDVPAQRYGPVF